MSGKKRIGGLLIAALFPLALLFIWLKWGGPSVEDRLQDGVSEEDMRFFRNNPEAMEEVKVLVTEASYAERSSKLGGSTNAYPVVSGAAQVLVKSGRREDYDALLADLSKLVTSSSFLMVGKAEVVAVTDAGQVVDYALDKWGTADTVERLALYTWVTVLVRQPIGDGPYQRWSNDLWESVRVDGFDPLWVENPFNRSGPGSSLTQSLYDPMLLAGFVGDRDWDKEAAALMSDDPGERAFSMRFLAGLAIHRTFNSDDRAEKLRRVATRGLSSEHPEIVEFCEEVLEREQIILDRAREAGR